MTDADHTPSAGSTSSWAGAASDMPASAMTAEQYLDHFDIQSTIQNIITELAKHRPDSMQASLDLVIDRLQDMTDNVPAQGRAYLVLANIHEIDAPEVLPDALAEAFLAFEGERQEQMPLVEDYIALLRALLSDFPENYRDELRALLIPCLPPYIPPPSSSSSKASPPAAPPASAPGSSVGASGGSGSDGTDGIAQDLSGMVPLPGTQAMEFASFAAGMKSCLLCRHFLMDVRAAYDESRDENSATADLASVISSLPERSIYSHSELNLTRAKLERAMFQKAPSLEPKHKEGSSFSLHALEAGAAVVCRDGLSFSALSLALGAASTSSPPSSSASSAVSSVAALPSARRE